MHIKLSLRLQAIADMVDFGVSVIDVGTDHGYIPVYLTQKRHVRNVTASDINEGPLDRARLSAAEYGVLDRITFVLRDGLKDMPSDEITGADTIIIAGMGGENISQILQQAPWTGNPGINLILQPMTKVHKLRQYLMENGYIIEKEVLVKDSGKIYPVMKVHGGGERACDINCVEVYLGKISKADELFNEYRDALTAKLTRAVLGMEMSENSAPDKLAGMVKILEEISATV